MDNNLLNTKTKHCIQMVRKNFSLFSCQFVLKIQNCFYYLKKCIGFKLEPPSWTFQNLFTIFFCSPKFSPHNNKHFFPHKPLRDSLFLLMAVHAVLSFQPYSHSLAFFFYLNLIHMAVGQK